MKTAAKQQPMCCVTVHYWTLLLPADKGLQLVKLLQSAVMAEPDYVADLGHVYTVKDMPDVTYQAIKSSQIRMPTPERAQPLPAIGRESLKLSFNREPS